MPDPRRSGGPIAAPGMTLMTTTEATIDPVCGMTVDPARAAGQVEHGGRTYYFCSTSCVKRFTADPEAFLNKKANANASCCDGEPANQPAAAPVSFVKRGPAAAPSAHVRPPASPHPKTTQYLLPDGPGGSPGSSRLLPEVRDGARTRPLDGAGRARGIHLPDASRHCSRRSGSLPDLRDGARTADRDRRRGAESGARRHDPADVDRGAVWPARVPAGHGRHDLRDGSWRAHRHGGHQLGRARLCHARGVLRGLAAARARMGVDPEPQREHVHAHRARCRRRLCLQRPGDCCARALSRRAQSARGGRSVLRHRRRDHRARAARSGARAARARPHRRGNPAAARVGSENRARDSRRP